LQLLGVPPRINIGQLWTKATTPSVQPVLSPLAHLGIGCKSREAVDMLCDKARQAGLLVQEPKDSGYPIGYWAFLRDPDGHTLELSYGQEIGLTVTQES
jgi:catechol 2,3-dioxygenase-like lactoylglutathione lyase family enzyme